MQTFEPDMNDERRRTAARAPERRMSAEERREMDELRESLEKIRARMTELKAAVTAIEQAPLTREELNERSARGEKAMRNAGGSSHDDVILRIGKAAEDIYVEGLRAKRVAESPEGQELRRLQNREMDITERLQQLESGE